MVEEYRSKLELDLSVPRTSISSKPPTRNTRIRATRHWSWKRREVSVQIARQEMKDWMSGWDGAAVASSQVEYLRREKLRRLVTQPRWS